MATLLVVVDYHISNDIWTTTNNSTTRRKLTVNYKTLLILNQLIATSRSELVAHLIQSQQLVVNYQLYTNTNSTDGNSTSCIKFVLHYQFSTNSKLVVILLLAINR